MRLQKEPETTAVRASRETVLRTLAKSMHALAIDPAARFHLPKMFGAGGHSFVPRPDDLALALGRVCADMAR